MKALEGEKCKVLRSSAKRRTALREAIVFSKEIDVELEDRRKLTITNKSEDVIEERSVALNSELKFEVILMVALTAVFTGIISMVSVEPYTHWNILLGWAG